jgi:hypothetical protein
MNLHPGGFSLVELLIALVQTARVVTSQIADEVRMSGQEVPVYSSNWDFTSAEAVAAILATSSNTRIDFRAGLSNTETAVTGPSPLDIDLYATRTLTVSDGSAFSTTLATTWPTGKFVYIWGPTSASTWAWVRAQLINITPSTLMVTPQQSSSMVSTVHFTGLPTISLEEAVSIYLNGDSVRRATATDMSNPAVPIWSPANEIGKNVKSLGFIYYDENGKVIAPTSLANRNSITRVDIQLTAETANILSNGTQPTYSLGLRTIPRNLALRSAN